MSENQNLVDKCKDSMVQHSVNVVRTNRNYCGLVFPKFFNDECRCKYLGPVQVEDIGTGNYEHLREVYICTKGEK